MLNQRVVYDVDPASHATPYSMTWPALSKAAGGIVRSRARAARDEGVIIDGARNVGELLDSGQEDQPDTHRRRRHLV